jgi:hypothetical protein
MFSYFKKLYSFISNDKTNDVSNIIKYEQNIEKNNDDKDNKNNNFEIMDKKQYHYDLYQKSLIQLSKISNELLKFETYAEDANISPEERNNLKKLYKLKLEDYDHAFYDMIKYRELFESTE